MQLSYSRLSAFMNCGLLYRLRYVEKVPARPKPHLGFGRILHSTLDRFYAKVTSQRSESELHRLKSGLHSIVDRMLSGEHFDPQEGIECKWCDYKRYCHLKTEYPLELPRRQIQPELEFSRS